VNPSAAVRALVIALVAVMAVDLPAAWILADRSFLLYMTLTVPLGCVVFVTVLKSLAGRTP